METLDHKTDPTKLWINIKAIDDKSTPKAENEAITVPAISAYTRWNCLATTDVSKSRSTPILTVRCSFQRVFWLGLVRSG